MDFRWRFDGSSLPYHATQAGESRVKPACRRDSASKGIIAARCSADNGGWGTSS
jgi:hypothetical protein